MSWLSRFYCPWRSLTEDRCKPVRFSEVLLSRKIWPGLPRPWWEKDLPGIARCKIEQGFPVATAIWLIRITIGPGLPLADACYWVGSHYLKHFSLSPNTIYFPGCFQVDGLKNTVVCMKSSFLIYRILRQVPPPRYNPFPPDWFRDTNSFRSDWFRDTKDGRLKRWQVHFSCAIYTAVSLIRTCASGLHTRSVMA